MPGQQILKKLGRRLLIAFVLCLEKMVLISFFIIGSYNAVHGSDSIFSAEREINVIFGSEERPQKTETLDAVKSQPTSPKLSNQKSLSKNASKASLKAENYADLEKASAQEPIAPTEPATIKKQSSVKKLGEKILSEKVLVATSLEKSASLQKMDSKVLSDKNISSASNSSQDPKGSAPASARQSKVNLKSSASNLIGRKDVKGSKASLRSQKLSGSQNNLADEKSHEPAGDPTKDTAPAL